MSRAPRTSALESAVVARLDAMRRLSMGATHALNNAFTTLIGEVSFLQDDRKTDPVVAEACETLMAELDRCARITRALLARRQPAASDAETDLVGLVRELGALLQETLGSQHQLAVETPDDVVPVAGPTVDLELLVLGIVHYAADGAEGPTTLTLRVAAADADGMARLSLDVRGAGLPAEAEALFLAPERADDALTASLLDAVARIVSARGGARHAARTAPDAWRARLALPVVA